MLRPTYGRLASRLAPAMTTMPQSMGIPLNPSEPFSMSARIRARADGSRSRSSKAGPPPAWAQLGTAAWR